jgi:sugar phosphate isomerase/epimerase
MFKALSPHAIQVRPGSLQVAMELARRGGFEGLEFNVREIADLVDQRGAEQVRGLFAQSGLKPAGFGLPVDWRAEESKWRTGLEDLPRLAQAAAGIGATRTFTWILPGSDERDFEANRRFHVERFTPIAQILGDSGCSLGLEFIGPKTLRGRFRHPFVYRMGAMLELGAAIGPNVGLLLDCWHWYTSGGTVEELRALRPEQVVYVHVNDAPAGIALDEQIDNVRALPGETGVIDIATFLRSLQTIGYDGPVVPEPFKQSLADLASDEARVTTVGAAMDKIFGQAGL